MDSTASVFFEGHLYQFVNETVTWNQANGLVQNLTTECSVQGHLVSITSQEEKDFVDSLFEGSEYRGYWLGLNDIELEGTYEWTSGEPFDFDAWYTPHEPNNFDSVEHCVHTQASKDFLWNDDNCNRLRLPYMVEYDCEYTETHNGHLYVTTGVIKNWNQANRDAQSRTECGVNGHLVTITSQEELDFIDSMYRKSGLPVSGLSVTVWIGLSDLLSEGVYQWVTGEPFDFTAWGPSEPNNSGRSGRSEDCAGLTVRTNNVTWNDAACHNLKYPYIIEFDCPPDSTSPPSDRPTLGPISAADTEAPSVPTTVSQSSSNQQPTGLSASSDDKAKTSPRMPIILSLVVVIPILVVAAWYLRKRSWSRRGVPRKLDPPATGDASGPAATPAFKDQCHSYDAPPLAVVTAVPMRIDDNA